MNIDPTQIEQAIGEIGNAVDTVVETVKDKVDLSLLDRLGQLIETYTVGLPVGTVALICLVAGMLLRRIVLKIIGLVLILAAILFFVLKV